LEASALKLEPLPFLVEDVVADCVELLLPLVRSERLMVSLFTWIYKAARKLDLSYDISPQVPLWAIGDHSRIRQGDCSSLTLESSNFISVLMNLVGNALKFTEKGSVSTRCYVDSAIPCGEDEVVLKWVIQLVTVLSLLIVFHALCKGYWYWDV
jgi:signal transduction histidine kinase